MQVNNVIILMEHLIKPEYIKDTTIVENYVYAWSNNKNTVYLFHSEIPFKKFERFIDELVDNGFVQIREVSKEEYFDLCVKYYLNKTMIGTANFNSVLNSLKK